MTSVAAALHRFALTGSIPRLGRVRLTSQVLAALAPAQAQGSWRAAVRPRFHSAAWLG